MAGAVRSLVPFAHVKNVPASVAFYGLLGFKPVNTFTPQGRDVVTWAYLRAGRAELMVAEAEKPVVPSQQAVLFYVYCDDVQSLRADLVSGGVSSGPITTPFYAPRGEFRIEDPDGYVVMVTHT